MAEGNWDFNIKAIKDSESNTYEVNKSLNLTDEEINIEKLVVTPLNNRLTFSGITSDYENFRIDENKFIARDNTGSSTDIDKSYYRVMVFFRVDLPVIGNLTTFKIKGETESIYYAKDESASRTCS